MKRVWSVIYSNKKKFPKAKQCGFFIFYWQDHYKNVYQVSFCYEFIPGFESYLTSLTCLELNFLLCKREGGGSSNYVFFYTPWKHQKTPGVLLFPGGIERDQCFQMAQKGEKGDLHCTITSTDMLCSCRFWKE